MLEIEPSQYFFINILHISFDYFSLRYFILLSRSFTTFHFTSFRTFLQILNGIYFFERQDIFYFFRRYEDLSARLHASSPLLQFFLHPLMLMLLSRHEFR